MTRRFLTMFLTILPAMAGAQAEPLRVLATVGMVADVVRQVGGERVDVTTLMGPGTDPHLYQASASDVRAMQQAEIIFYSGYSLEGQLGDVLGRFGRQKPVLAVSPAAISPEDLISVQGVYGIDPHLWMDVSLWSEIAEPIAAALGERDPDGAELFRENARSYRVQLEALHGWIGRTIATIPEQQRILVTAHDAFAYYGRAYGIEVAGIQGISTEAEAGIADIRQIVDIVVERAIPAVFVESTINPRTIQAVIEAAAERGQEVRLGGQLFSDAMGAPGSLGESYLGMLYSNTSAIAEALGGTVLALPAPLAAWAGPWELPVEE